jgi:hypothetical protein
LSTPVIDPDTNTIFLVANTFENGHSVYTLHALDVLTGEEKFGSGTVISGSVPGNGAGGVGGTLTFDPDQHLQRPGLVLHNGTVYVSFGSHADITPFHGWVFRFDEADLHQTGIWCSTPDGDAGSVWQAGHAPAVDSEGNLYVVTGNGDYNGVSNFGQSVVKLDVSRGISVADWFTPDNWLAEALADNDLGSTGPMLVPGTGQIIGTGKQGIVYLMDLNLLGHLQAGNGQIPQSFQAVPYGIFSMAYWARPSGLLLYMWGWSDSLRSYRMAGATFDTTPFSVNPMLSGTPYVGMAISADADVAGSGILWVTAAPRIDQPEPGTLHAFDASDISRELWNSDQVPGRDGLGYFAKFATPTVANGRVFVPTFSNSVVTYGLLDPHHPPGDRSRFPIKPGFPRELR